LRSLFAGGRAGLAVSAVDGQFRVVQGIEQVPEAAWRDLAEDHPALRLEVLKAATRGWVRPLRLQPFLLEDHQGLAAAAVCEAVTTAEAHNPLDALLFGRAAGAASRLGLSSRPVLVFHTPMRRQAPVMLRPAAPAEQRQVLERLLEGIEEHAATLACGIAFVGVTTEDEPLCSALRGRGYLASALDSTACMAIEWVDFDGYVEHLRADSRNAAQTARKERSRSRKSGISIGPLRIGAAEARALYALVREHYQHKNGRDPPYGPEYLAQLNESLGDDLLILEALRGAARVAVLVVVRSGATGWGAMFGMDLRDRANDFTYANLLFYSAADWAPALGLKTLLYGTGAEQAKLRRGCRLLTSHLYYRPRRPIGRMLAAPYLRMHRAWQRRKSR
jgi:predicted N-acyltransferase